MSWIKSLLLTCQILGLLVNTLDAEDKYPVPNRDNLTIPIEMQLSQEEKRFSPVLAALSKSSLNVEHFEKKMSLIDFAFLKLQTLKTWSDKCLKGSLGEDPLQATW